LFEIIPGKKLSAFMIWKKQRNIKTYFKHKSSKYFFHSFNRKLSKMAEEMCGQTETENIKK
jgi:hypothetical protein